jgi:hypothetical protein
MPPTVAGLGGYVTKGGDQIKGARGLNGGVLLFLILIFFLSRQPSGAVQDSFKRLSCSFGDRPCTEFPP